MKIKIIILIAVAIATILTVVWFLLYPDGKEAAKDAVQSAPEEEVIAQSDLPEFLQERLKQFKNLPAREKIMKGKLPTDEKKLQKQIEKDVQLGLAMNQPIIFYGKLVDQDHQPVGDADIEIYLSHFSNTLPLPDIKLVKRKSDASGLFSLTNEKGLSVEIYPRKDGYKFSRRRLGYRKGTVHTKLGRSASMPVVFRGYKIDEVVSQELITKNLFLGFIPDGRYYTLDLVKGLKLEGKQDGDLWVSIYRDPGATVKGTYDWYIQIEANGGGILESEDPLMYQAPASGYQPIWRIEYKKADKLWTHPVRRKFFTSSRNGQVYSKIHLTIYAFYNEKTPAAIRVKAWTNPTGSRRLYGGK